MVDALAFLAFPALACAALVGIHAYFGLRVFQRNVIFVDLALAQVAALGAAAAFILIAAAAAMLLLREHAPQGAGHVLQILSGNILTLGWVELRWAIPLYLLAGIAHAFVRIRNPWLSEFIFYTALAVVVASSIALAGVLLVFAFLVIPAAIGVLHARTFRAQLAIAWAAGTAAAVAGLAIAYAGDFSPVVSIVCMCGFALAVAAVAVSLRAPQPYGAKFEIAARFARWLAAAVLAASAAWIVVAPTADQPVLDALERMFPAVRTAYMDDAPVAISGDPARSGGRVDRQARNRARQEQRGWIGGVFLIFALALLVRPRHFESSRGSTL